MCYGDKRFILKKKKKDNIIIKVKFISIKNVLFVYIVEHSGSFREICISIALIINANYH